MQKGSRDGPSKDLTSEDQPNTRICYSRTTLAQACTGGRDCAGDLLHWAFSCQHALCGSAFAPTLHQQRLCRRSTYPGVHALVNLLNKLSSTIASRSLASTVANVRMTRSCKDVFIQHSFLCVAISCVMIDRYRSSNYIRSIA